MTARSTASLVCRTATLADAEPVARFHVAVWHETYRDMAPPEAVAQLGFERRLIAWRESLADADPRRVTVIAEQHGQIVGLVSVGPTQAPLYAGRGEIKHLYVGPAARRLGLGATLLAEGRNVLARAGFPGAALGVVRENARARAFYAAQQGREIGRFTDPGPLWRSDMILIAWDRTRD
ncbi:GNAT family N-acetyltransferase [Pararhodobacter zhoushanensis]|uniref:GNAT family N-acetyltransferase n=1 Tax=Pararhodobacter zhoushanensis TaxID=2479545 RepID=A0ABT3GWL7_9RHOB|nr:GNAT family N-acetyltransferase [Pararhodobacter zhoushanensis]MCW1931912.1 GNAT family N-acetyltransferase [Pararhodobacter zhoushanensis]